MKFRTTSGRMATLKNASKYAIDWNRPSRSKFQTKVKEILYNKWFGDLVYEELRIAGTSLSLDFYNASKKIAIEVQGAQHLKFTSMFHKTKNDFLRQLKRDEKKLNFCRLNNIVLLEVYPQDKLDDDLLKRLLENT